LSGPDALPPRASLRRATGLAALLAAGALAAAWAPFPARLDLLVRHFDAPNYLVVAKTFYVPTQTNPLPGYALGPKYFTTHTPLFPAVIRACSFGLGYARGLALATVLLALASAAMFAAWAREAAPEVPSAIAVLAFLLLPARMFLYRSLGASEALMSLCVLAAAYAWRRGRMDWAFLAAALATVTRTNGVLVVGVLGVLLLAERRVRTAVVGGALAAVPLVLLFSWYAFLYGDFFSLLHVHADSAQGTGRLTFPFGFVGEMAAKNDWETAEMLLALHLFYVLCAARLWLRRDRFEAGLLIAHVVLLSLLRERDLARYYLTVAPFAVVLGFRDVWARPRLAAGVLAVLGSLSVFYAWKTIPMNLASPEATATLLRFLAS
jgi:hypothetical protein